MRTLVVMTQADSEIRDLLVALFEGVKRYGWREDTDDADVSRSYMFSDADGVRTVIAFENEVHTLLTKASRALARHALSAEGLSPGRIQGVIARACWMLPDVGVDKALDMVLDGVDAPVRQYRVSFTNADRLVHDPFASGAVTFSKDFPAHLHDWRNDDGSIGATFQHLKPPVATVVVTGCDEGSAVLLAAERLDEGRAVLGLAQSGRVKQTMPGYVLDGAKSNSVSLSSARFGERSLDATGFISSDGKWWPGYQELSAAAARPERDRNDWERRVLAAARWYLHACETTWYSEALVQAMSALECLYVPTGQNDKGSAIAVRATEWFVMPGRSRASQRKWLRRLYSLRNDAVHEGLSMEQDLDVEELLSLAEALLQRAVFHLNPMHRLPNAPCSSLGEVWDRDRHSDEYRGPSGDRAAT